MEIFNLRRLRFVGFGTLRTSLRRCLAGGENPGFLDGGLRGQRLGGQGAESGGCRLMYMLCEERQGLYCSVFFVILVYRGSYDYPIIFGGFLS